MFEQVECWSGQEELQATCPTGGFKKLTSSPVGTHSYSNIIELFEQSLSISKAISWSSLFRDPFLTIDVTLWLSANHFTLWLANQFFSCRLQYAQYCYQFSPGRWLDALSAYHWPCDTPLIFLTSYPAYPLWLASENTIFEHLTSSSMSTKFTSLKWDWQNFNCSKQFSDTWT